MKVSAFTFLRNGTLLGYPYIESIKSILPIVDEFIVNIGNSEDDTLEQVRAIGDPKIKIIESVWNENMREKGFAYVQQRTIAQFHCTGDWAFYLEADEIVHEDDLPKIKECMERHINNPEIEALVFDYYHFFGSADYIGKCPPFYCQEVRIIRNNLRWMTPSDTQFFVIMKKNRWGRYPKAAAIGVPMYHYGNCRSVDQMQNKVNKISKYWGQEGAQPSFVYDVDPDALRTFEGQHPVIMNDWIRNKSEKGFRLNSDRTPSKTERRHRIGRKLKETVGLDTTKKHFKLFKS